MSITLPTPGGDVGTWGTELNLWLQTAVNDYNVELDPYNATPMKFVRDASVTSGSDVLTSATANFTADDVGKTLIVSNGGPSRNQSLNTTIDGFTSSTTVSMAHNAGRTQANARILYGSDSTTAIQAALDDAEDTSGLVYLPGPGYVTTGLDLPGNVVLAGTGQFSTRLVLAASSNRPVIYNKQVQENSAQQCGIINLGIHGSRDRQTAFSTTLGAGYTAGNTTLTLASGAGASCPNAGVVLVGSNLLQYTGKSGDQLTGVLGGRETTSDANAANGAAAVVFRNYGFLYNSMDGAVQGDEEQDFDAKWFAINCYFFSVGDTISSPYGGWAFAAFNRSAGRIINCAAYYCNNGFRIPYDTWVTDTDAGQIARIGFLSFGSSSNFSNVKAWYCGTGGIAGQGQGMIVEPTTNQPVEGCITLAGYNAQDNASEGLFLRYADRVVGTAVLSSNSRTGVGSYAGARLFSANYCDLTITSTERADGGGSSNQQNALLIDATSNYNQLAITHGAASSATVGAAIMSGSDLSGGNNIRINAQGGAITTGTINNTGTVTATAATNLLTRTTHGLVAGDAVMFTTTTTLPSPLVANQPYYVISSGLTANDFKVSTSYGGTEVDITTTGSGTHTMWEGVAADPYKATTNRITLGQANTPIALPINQHLGAEITYLFRQDATGGRVVYFDPTYVTNGWRVNDEPNAYSQVTFFYDGTSWVTTERIAVAGLSANQSNSTTTGTEVTGLEFKGVGAGRYLFKYTIVYQSAATTTGVKFGVNHTGASSTVVVTSLWPGVGTTAITVSDTDQVANTFQLVGHMSARSMSTTAPNLGPTTAVDTQNADNLVIIEGILTVTNIGDLELWHGSEVAAQSTVMAGSTAVLTKVT